MDKGKIEWAVNHARDQGSFLNLLLRDGLDWPVDQGVKKVEDIAYGWSKDDLQIEGMEKHFVDGQIWQIQPLDPKRKQPWGIFLLEFARPDVFTSGRGITGPLRRILRRLVPKRRQQASHAVWDRGNLLFICTHSYEHFSIAYFKKPPEGSKTAPLAIFGWGPDIPARTAIDLNLPALDWPEDDVPREKWVAQWASAFDVESVSKEFYTEIAKLFTDLVGGERKIGSKTYKKDPTLKFPNSNDMERKEFAVRLIGRLVFCWFLKKKTSEAGVPLIPEEILSSAALARNTRYYHNVLEPLFFETLNKDKALRHKNYRDQYWDTIPFLNGGLFESHPSDFYEFDDVTGLSAKYLNILDVPDQWFTHLLEVFDRYNFTIEESSPLDIEVAIDPEILGRIFENLLAEINPETGETARKSTGSYYTPRQIVEYMVHESVKQYLLSATNILEDGIESLLSYDNSDNPLTEEQTITVIDRLHEIKILDPACGSGAFPMGILQKIIFALEKLDPDGTRWKERILGAISDPTYRNALKDKLDNETWQYIHKLGVIRTSIYGVDIQPIAVEIAKLRVFLSLVVDETVNDRRNNRGIEPLPNLEFKFVCANTLIGLSNMSGGGSGLFDTGPVEEYKNKLKALRDDYFTCGPNDKPGIIAGFAATQKRLFEYIIDSGLCGKDGLKSEIALKLTGWKPVDNTPSVWFDPDWMFGITDGFDIVIANPPWGVKFDDYKAILEDIKKRLDSSEYFIIKCILFLKSKGIQSFIVPKSLIFANNWSCSRQHILNKQICNIADAGITFENVDYESFVFILRNQDFGVDRLVHRGRFEPVRRYSPHKQLSMMIPLSQSSMREIDSIMLANLSKADQAILAKIKASAEYLSQVKRQVFRGLYVSDSLKEIVLGRGKSLFVNKVPDVSQYAIKRIYNIDLRGQEQLLRIAEKVSRDRIIIKVLRGAKLTCAYASKDILTTEKLVNLRIEDERYHDFYVLALLNSRMISFFLAKAVFSDITETSRVMDDCYLRKAPIRAISPKQQEPFVALVDNILAVKANDPMADTTALEAQIDRLVYSLYGLTEEEVAIVEGKG